MRLARVNGSVATKEQRSRDKSPAHARGDARNARTLPPLVRARRYPTSQPQLTSTFISQLVASHGSPHKQAASHRRQHRHLLLQAAPCLVLYKEEHTHTHSAAHTAQAPLETQHTAVRVLVGCMCDLTPPSSSFSSSVSCLWRVCEGGCGDNGSTAAHPSDRSDNSSSSAARAHAPQPCADAAAVQRCQPETPNASPSPRLPPCPSSSFSSCPRPAVA